MSYRITYSLFTWILESLPGIATARRSKAAPQDGLWCPPPVTSTATHTHRALGLDVVDAVSWPDSKVLIHSVYNALDMRRHTLLCLCCFRILARAHVASMSLCSSRASHQFRPLRIHLLGSFYKIQDFLYSGLQLGRAMLRLRGFYEIQDFLHALSDFGPC